MRGKVPLPLLPVVDPLPFLELACIRAPKNKPEAVDQEAKNWPSVWEDLGVPSPSNQAKGRFK